MDGRWECCHEKGRGERIHCRASARLYEVDRTSRGKYISFERGPLPCEDEGEGRWKIARDHECKLSPSNIVSVQWMFATLVDERRRLSSNTHLARAAKELMDGEDSVVARVVCVVAGGAVGNLAVGPTQGEVVRNGDGLVVGDKEPKLRPPVVVGA